MNSSYEDLQDLNDQQCFDLLLSFNQQFCNKSDTLPNEYFARFISHLYSGQSDCLLRSCREDIGRTISLFDSLKDFYSLGFAARCQAVLRHGSQDSMPLEDVCYMFWELHRGLNSLLKFYSNAPRVVEGAFELLTATLRLDHVTCRESAVHALGHLLYEDAFCKCAAAMLEEYLAFELDGHPLSDYAIDALNRRIL